MNKSTIYIALAVLLAIPQLSLAQNVGIGTTTPTAPLDVSGTVRIRGGSPAAGKVLTSDANGNGSWQSNTSGFLCTPSATISQDFPYDVDSIINFVTANGVGGVGFDDGLNYDNATYAYTASSSGFYQFQFSLRTDQAFATQNGTIAIIFNYNGSNNYHQWVHTAMNGDLINMPISGTITLKLIAGDKVKLKLKQNVRSTISISDARFSGYKIY